MGSHALIKLCITCCLLVTLTLATTSQQDPQPPTIANTFTSSFYWSRGQTGRIFYSEPAKSYVWITSQPYFAAPPTYNYMLNMTRWVNATTKFDETNGQCRSGRGGFSPFFDWVPTSHFIRVETVDGRVTNEFGITTTDGTQYAVNVEISTGFPVRYTAFRDTITFFDYHFGADFQTSFDPQRLNITPACAKGPYTCARGPVEDMQVMRIHAPSDYSITNDNTGDIAGDAAYICTKAWSSTPYEISIFNVMFNTTYGQYGLCNFGECVGGTPNTVGRSAMGNLKQNSGQCDANEDTGVWYSTDHRWECTGNQQVGDGGCAWKLIKRAKTVKLSCLVANGLRSACEQDQVIPFARTRKVITNAFSSTNPAQGGCPAINPETIHTKRSISEVELPPHATVTEMELLGKFEFDT